MAKRARYDGPHPGVHVEVAGTYDENGVLVKEGAEFYVERGHLLPDDVPAETRDNLLDTDDWSEVKQQTTQSSQSRED